MKETPAQHGDGGWLEKIKELSEPDKLLLDAVAEKCGPEIIPKILLNARNISISEKITPDNHISPYLDDYDRDWTRLSGHGVTRDTLRPENLFPGDTGYEFLIMSREEYRRWLIEEEQKHREGVRNEFHQAILDAATQLSDDEFNSLLSFAGVRVTDSGDVLCDPVSGEREVLIRQVGRIMSAGLRDFARMNPHLMPGLSHQLTGTPIESRRLRVSLEKLREHDRVRAIASEIITNVGDELRRQPRDLSQIQGLVERFLATLEPTLRGNQQFMVYAQDLRTHGVKDYIGFLVDLLVRLRDLPSVDLPKES